MILTYADRRPVVVNFNETLLKVSREMLTRNRNHAILINESGLPWGVISIRDVAKAIFIEGEEGVELIEAGSLGKVLESPAKTYASRPPITISPEASLKEAVKILVDRNIGFLPILDENGKVLGALEEKNLARAISDVNLTSVCSEASWDLVTIESDEEILAAVGIMLTTGIRHLVVIENGSIYGLASLLKALYFITSESSIGELLRGSRRPIEEGVKLITENPWVLDCSYSLREAASLLATERMGAVFVKSEEGSVGLLTDRDLIRILDEELEKD
ncbi:MAG: CBS domain-containing protein [Desulfurococcales archaeon]